ncbi:Phosphoribosylamine--glycine ligase [Trypanosoma cruzi]|nr:Phosphoribosylamine--glycine ligase [Trypanosoma cruzi]
MTQSNIDQRAYETLRRLGCSEETASRLLYRWWPDIEGCVEELRRRRMPSLMALEVFSQQRNYFRNLSKSMLPIGKTQLPCFREEHLDEPSSGYPTLTWGEVAERINSSPEVEIFFLDVESGIITDFDSYEEYYQNNILAEGFMDIVAFTTTVDGLVPLVDYLHARHFGGMLPPRACTLRGPCVLSSNGRSINFTSGISLGNDVTRTIRSEQVILQPPRRRTRILLGNDVLTSVKQRQDKDGMQRALKAHGLTHIRGISGFSAADAKRWRREQKIPFPVIVKPVSGAGSELVTICYSDEEIDTAFSLTRNVRTTQMTDASHMLLQEYIEGQEYVVNIVSYNGKHVVSDVWKSWKYPISLYSTRLLPSVEERLRREYKCTGRGRLPVQQNSTALLYDRIEFVHNLSELDPSSEVRRVVAYTLQCVDALGMRQGCSHCEVRIDNRFGSVSQGMPILIELNPRMLGDTPRATPLVGYDQYMLLMYLVLSAAAIPEETFSPVHCCSHNSDDGRRKEEDMQGLLPWPPAPLLYKSLANEVSCHVVFLRAAECSVVCNPCIHDIIALPTFAYFTRGNIFDHLGKLGTLTSVEKTVDLLTSPVACVLIGPVEEIRRDTEYIRRVENKDLTAWLPLLNAALELRPAFQGQASTFPCPCSETSSDTKLAKKERKLHPANNASSFNAAVDEVVSFFTRMELPLFVPVDYFLKLKTLGLEHLVLGVSGGAKDNA